MKRKILFFTLLFAGFLSFHRLFAQNYEKELQENFRPAFMDMGDVETKVTKLLASEPATNQQEIQSQLRQRKEAQVNIKRQQVGKKELSNVELARRVRLSTVVIGNAYDCGKCHRTHVAPAATGYIIDEDGIIVTNYHVIDSARNRVNGTKKELFVMTDEGDIFFIKEVLASSLDDDLAVVRVDTKGKKLKVLPLGHTAQQGEDVYVMGHPRHNLYYWSKGIVARNVMGRSVMNRHAVVPLMEITADYGVGASGGPVVDKYGNVVGTVSSTVSIYADEAAQRGFQMSIKTTIPVIQLKRLIKLQ